MDYGRITTEYLCYLMNRIGLEAEGDDGYLCLCKLLQDIFFLPRIDMDENRCRECRELRRDFEDYEYGDHDVEGIYVTDILDGVLSENGTMLELLAVLSERISFELSDSEYDAAPEKWFLEMLENCGLKGCLTNADFEREENEQSIRDALKAVIDHSIGWDGEGGFFPLRYPQYDQRNVELIIQMNNYLAENYDIC